MTRGDYQLLLSEKTALQRMLEATSADQVITRGSLQSRLDSVESNLAAAQVDEREAASLKLTFRGKPVVGSEGIFADFGAKVVARFNELVATLAAASDGPLAGRGPIPNREQHQLLITATAQGSFGFELREYVTGQTAFSDDLGTKQAMGKAHALLKGLAGSDEELADAADEVDPRAIDKLRTFLQTMAEAGAWCAATYGGMEARLPSLEHVKAGIERLQTTNLVEQEKIIDGMLRGILPGAREFEFQPSAGGKPIHGKVAAGLQGIDRLNQLLDQPIRIKVLETRVGKGSVRYRLLEAPTGQQA